MIKDYYINFTRTESMVIFLKCLNVSVTLKYGQMKRLKKVILDMDEMAL